MIALAQTSMSEQEWSVADMRRLALDRRFDGIRRRFRGRQAHCRRCAKL
jgi:hypothetical protein